jgi:hypothetical protein
VASACRAKRTPSTKRRRGGQGAIVLSVAESDGAAGEVAAKREDVIGLALP